MTESRPSFEHPPAGSSKCGGSPVVRRRRRLVPTSARPPVLHEALVDADLLYQVLEDDEQQRDEPEQHQL